MDYSMWIFYCDFFSWVIWCCYFDTYENTILWTAELAQESCSYDSEKENLENTKNQSIPSNTECEQEEGWCESNGIYTHEILEDEDVDSHTKFSDKISTKKVRIIRKIGIIFIFIHQIFYFLCGFAW